MERIGDHSPGEALLIDGPSTVLKVATHQGFSARDNHKHLMGVRLSGDAVEHTKKVLLRHVLALGLHLAVAAAMTALQVAAEGTLPKELSQRMLLPDQRLALSP